MSGRACATASAALAITFAIALRGGRHAQAQTSHPAALTMTATPIFGPDAALGLGEQELLVTLVNADTAARKGTLELRATQPWVGHADAFITRAPFNVAGGRTALVRIPTRALGSQPPALALAAKDDSGAVMAQTDVAVNMSVAPTLVEIVPTPRMGVVLRGRAMIGVTTASRPGAMGVSTSGPVKLTVGASQVDATTGDPLLPLTAASYSGVTVALIRGDVLSKLSAEPLEALRDWVVGGGTLAVLVTRPEDLRTANLTAMTGEPIVEVAPNPALFSLPSAPTVPAPRHTPPSQLGGDSPTEGPSDTPSPDLAPQPEPEDDDTATPLEFQLNTAKKTYIYQPIGLFFPARASKPNPAKAQGLTRADIKAALKGYSGGMLAPGHFGATAPFGTGQVHLLAFDPTTLPGLSDPWTQARVLDMVGEAWNRTGPVAFQIGAGDPESWGSRDKIRSALDPNENYRPALAFAALLLAAYAFIVGPLTFRRAQKNGTPLSPLKLAPLFSALAFSAIVAAGVAVKGIRGKSRRLSITEVGSGNPRGTVTRFRGFYTSDTRALSVLATDRSATLALFETESWRTARHADLRIDRTGYALEHLTALAWQTLVVRECATRTLKGAIDMAWTGPSGLDVTNRTGVALRDAVVWSPKSGIFYFAEIKAGETVPATGGKLLMAATAWSAVTFAPSAVHRLAVEAAVGPLQRTERDRLLGAWGPLEQAAGDAVDWWPSDLPVVLATLDGGEGETRDSGLLIDQDRALVRVLGRAFRP